MEKDDEIKGNGLSYNFGARMLDPRIGRWSMTDPLMNKYPSISPYNYAANSPLIVIDKDGRDIIIFFEKTTTLYVQTSYMGHTGIAKRVNMQNSYVVIPTPGPDRIFFSRTTEEINPYAIGRISGKLAVTPLRTKSNQFYELQPFDYLGVNDRHCTPCLQGDAPISKSGWIPDPDFIAVSKLVPDNLKEKLAEKDWRYNMLSAYQTENTITTIGLAAYDIATFLDGVGPSTINALKKAGGVNLTLKFKKGWTPEQRAAALKKVEELSKANTFVLKNPKRKSNTRGRFKKAGNDVDPTEDVDHLIDLQLGGADELENMWPLNSSVNRSLGSQINHQIKDLPEGTIINKIEIIDQ